ncbi:hypothetical protein J6590_077544 [Homalodisca vitripennis]|nr:hypothetical protein J6590_077544 [Homalodisca vitripennis]
MEYDEILNGPYTMRNDGTGKDRGPLAASANALVGSERASPPLSRERPAEAMSRNGECCGGYVGHSCTASSVDSSRASVLGPRCPVTSSVQRSGANLAASDKCVAVMLSVTKAVQLITLEYFFLRGDIKVTSFCMSVEYLKNEIKISEDCYAGTNGLNVTSEIPPTAGQAGCLQGQDRSAATHPSSSHARRCLTLLSCDSHFRGRWISELKNTPSKVRENSGLKIVLHPSSSERSLPFPIYFSDSGSVLERRISPAAHSSPHNVIRSAWGPIIFHGYQSGLINIEYLLKQIPLHKLGPYRKGVFENATENNVCLQHSRLRDVARDGRVASHNPATGENSLASAGPTPHSRLRWSPFRLII